MRRGQAWVSGNLGASSSSCLPHGRTGNNSQIFSMYQWTSSSFLQSALSQTRSYMLFYRLPLETHLDIHFCPRTKRRKPKLREIIWLPLLGPWDRQRQTVRPCPGKAIGGKLHPPLHGNVKGKRKLMLGQKSMRQNAKGRRAVSYGEEKSQYRQRKYLEIQKELPCGTESTHP